MHTTKDITKLAEDSCCLIWTITNFTLCSHKTSLISPLFSSNGNQWRVEFYPHNVADESSDEESINSLDDDSFEDEAVKSTSGMYVGLIDTKNIEPQEIACQIIISTKDTINIEHG